MVSHMMCPSVVLELGTFSGYGTLCLLEGLSEAAACIPWSATMSCLACRTNFGASPPKWTHPASPRHGDACAQELGYPGGRSAIDLAYVDADKQGVVEQFECPAALDVQSGLDPV